MNYLILFIVLFGGFLAWGYWESGREERAKAFIYKCLNKTFSNHFLGEQKKIRENNRVRVFGEFGLSVDNLQWYMNTQQMRQRSMNLIIQEPLPKFGQKD